MDLNTVVGLVAAIGCVLVAALEEHVPLAYFAQFSAALLIFGGTACATAISVSMKEIKTLPTYLKLAIFKSDDTPLLEEIQKIVTFAEKARREGLLALEDNTREMEPGFARTMLQMIVDGTEPEIVKHIMDTEIAAIELRHKRGADLFNTAGGFSPTMGIIGTVMGVVVVLANLGSSNMDQLGKGVAVAFVATFFGISVANLILLPIGGKLKYKSEEEVFRMNLIVEGYKALQAGENPTVVRTRLLSFLEAKQRPRDEV